MSSIESALLCYEILCSFQPEVSSYQLSALESACSTDESSIEVCPSFIAGAAFGATRRSAAPAPSNEEAALPSGLVASAGHPSQYAAVYAVGGVLRACKLLSADEAALSRALASYELPHTAEDDPPSVPEALVPEPPPAPAGVTTRGVGRRTGRRRRRLRAARARDARDGGRRGHHHAAARAAKS